MHVWLLQITRVMDFEKHGKATNELQNITFWFIDATLIVAFRNQFVNKHVPRVRECYSLISFRSNSSVDSISVTFRLGLTSLNGKH